MIEMTMIYFVHWFTSRLNTFSVFIVSLPKLYLRSFVANSLIDEHFLDACMVNVFP